MAVAVTGGSNHARHLQSDAARIRELRRDK